MHNRRLWRTSLAVALVTGAAPLAQPRASSTVRARADPIGLVGHPWHFPAPVSGLGYAGRGRLWVFLSRRVSNPPDALWQVVPASQRVLLKVALPAAVSSYGSSPDGAAFVSSASQGPKLSEWWGGRRLTYGLPTGTEPIALAPVSHAATWVAFRLGLTGRVEVGLYRLPEEVLVYAHHIAGMANEIVSSLAPAPGGCWLASSPRPVLYWVGDSGGPSTYTSQYAHAYPMTAAQSLGDLTVDAHGTGWVSGYTTTGAPSVWRLVGNKPMGEPVMVPSGTGTASGGLAVAESGVAYLGFSDRAGKSEIPGVAIVSPNHAVHVSTWPNLAVSGYAAGHDGAGSAPLLFTPAGQLWASMPASHLVFQLSTGPASSPNLLSS